MILDTRNAPNRLREVARMCDVGGIDVCWVRDQLRAEDGAPRLEAWTALTLASVDAPRPRIGASLSMAFRPVATLAAMAGTLDSAAGGRLELTIFAGRSEEEHLAFGFDFPEAEARAARLERYVTVLRRLLAGEAVSVGGGIDVPEAELGVGSPQPGGPRIALEAGSGPELDAAAGVADDILLPPRPLSGVAESIRRVREACERAERDPLSLGVALEVPVSIGRTHAEATARAAVEPLFAESGHPSVAGIFGTLEECQDRVIELAHAGVTDLRCVLPNTLDVHDVIAQVTAIAVGSTDIFRPGAPRSKAPDPPQGWGGRRIFPQ